MDLSGLIDSYVSSGDMGNNYSALGSAIDSYANSGTDYDMSSSGLGGLDTGMLLNTLGRLGVGIGSGVSAYQSGNKPTYIPTTRWLGNGLAMTGLSSNLANRLSNLDQAYGSGRALSSLLGQGYSLFGNNELDSNINKNSSFDTNYDMYGKSNYGAVGNAIDDYMRR